jgi:hypothetical protein
MLQTPHPDPNPGRALPRLQPTAPQFQSQTLKNDQPLWHRSTRLAKDGDPKNGRSDCAIARRAIPKTKKGTWQQRSAAARSRFERDVAIAR